MMWDPAEGEAAALWDLDDAEVERLRAAASGGTPAGGAVAGVLGTPSTGAAGGWCLSENLGWFRVRKRWFMAEGGEQGWLLICWDLDDAEVERLRVASQPASGTPALVAGGVGHCGRGAGHALDGGSRWVLCGWNLGRMRVRKRCCREGGGGFM